MNYQLKTINKEGQLVLKLFRSWRTESDPDIKTAIHESITRKLSHCPKAMDAFKKDDQEALAEALTHYEKFKADPQSRFDELSGFLNCDLVHDGGDRYELKLIDDKVCLERRIGLKASSLEEHGADEAEVRKFFLDGHAQAMIDVILIPELKKTLFMKLPRTIKVNIESDMTTKYRANALIQILMDMSFLEDPEEDLSIPIRILKLLDDYLQTHQLYF